MRTDHYGLARRPFQLRPNPAFFFAGRAHRRAIGCVALALRQEEDGGGVIVVTGGPGTGKSILLGCLEAALARACPGGRLAAGPGTAAADVPGLVAGALGLERDTLDGEALARLVAAELDALRRAGRRALLALDDAHLLDDPALEALGALVAGGDRAHLLLLGDGTLRERLARPPLGRLRRRTAGGAHLGPLGPDEVGPYLEHRLRRAGWTGRPALAPDLPAALAALAGGGVPGLINPLAARLLHHGALAGRDRLGADDLRRLGADEPAAPRPSGGGAPFALGEVAARALALAAPAAAARGLTLRLEPPDLPPPPVRDHPGDGGALEAALLALLRRGIGRAAPPPAPPATLTLALDHGPTPGGALLARFSLRGPGGGAAAGPDLRLERRLEVAEPDPFPPGPATPREGRRLRVLVAEDPVIDQLLIREMLRRRRHEAVLADDGTDAVSLAGRQRFDLVLVGDRMAPVDGPEATRRIRELPAPAGRVPVVALAADASPASRRRCREAGADHVLAKPVTWAGLSRALASVAALHSPGPAA